MDKTTIPYILNGTVQKPKNVTLVPKDSGSRYKTRQLQVQVVGTSKMIRTLLLNVLDVAKDMQIPPEYIGTFIGYELGVQAHFYAKKPPRQQAVISGEHPMEDLSKIVQQMIEEVLLCPVCGLPEVLLRVDEARVMGDCRACGSSSEMPISNLKFRRYLLSHSPAQKTGNAFQGNTTLAAPSNGAPKAAGKAAAKKTKKSSSDEGAAEEPQDEVVWYSDVSHEAVRKRKEEMVPKVLADEKKKPDVKEIAEILDQKDDNVVEKLKTYQAECGLSDQMVPLIFSALFSNELDAQQFKKKFADSKSLLSKILVSHELQVEFLSSFEQYVGKINSALLSKSAALLQAIYMEDVIEEEAVFKWFQSKNPDNLATVRKSVSPFIEWLKNAEEESDEE